MIHWIIEGLATFGAIVLCGLLSIITRPGFWKGFSSAYREASGAIHYRRNLNSAMRAAGFPKYICKICDLNYFWNGEGPQPVICPGCIKDPHISEEVKSEILSSNL